MKKTLLVILISILGISFSSQAQQYDFSSVVSGNTLYFKITAPATNMVEIVTELANSPYYTTQPTGAIVLPNTVTNNAISYTITSIGNNTFYNCDNITSIVFPSTLVSIGDLAFSGCTGLTTIDIPSSVTTIGDFAFWHCTGLTSITSNPIIPPTIQDSTFYNPVWIPLTIPVHVPCSALQDYQAANVWSNLTNYVCFNTQNPDITYVIGENTFFFNITDNVNNYVEITSQLPNQPFYQDNTIRPEGAVGIPQTIVYNDITYQVESIGDNSFTNCNNITSITIPSTILSIGENAFNGCTNISTITSNPINPPTTSPTSFEGISKTIPVIVTCQSLQDYQSAANWQDFTNIQCLLGIDEIPTTTELQTKLYPNPTNGIATLEIEAQTKAIGVFVYDVMGRNIKTYNLKANQKELNIDLTSFPKGIYQVKVENQTKKLIVK